MGVRNNADPPQRQSHLFMVRMWPEEMGSGQIDWRGSIRHVNTGEVRYFRDWPALETFVEGLVGSTCAKGPSFGEADAAGQQQLVGRAK